MDTRVIPALEQPFRTLKIRDYLCVIPDRFFKSSPNSPTSVWNGLPSSGLPEIR